jgi:hypothetical protein
MPMASSHIRMRLQSPMLTMSDTAPMVQKWVFWPMAPKTKATAKASQRTVLDATAVSMSGAVNGGVGDAGGGKAFGAQAAGIADPAGTALVVGLVAGNGQAVIDAERCPGG